MPGGAAGLQNQSGGRKVPGGFDSLPSPPMTLPPIQLDARAAFELRCQWNDCRVNACLHSVGEKKQDGDSLHHFVDDLPESPFRKSRRRRYSLAIAEDDDNDRQKEMRAGC